MSEVICLKKMRSANSIMIFTCIVPLSAHATPPKDIQLAFNPNEQTLSMTIIHASFMPGTHYIKTVARLVEAKEDLLKGNKESLPLIISSLETLTIFYPKNIEKEDKHFFYPVMEYFSAEEQAAMLEEFYEFDTKMIHEKYNRVAETIEKLAVNR